MIISASRRTDLPAFHADWFMASIRAGYCMVPNPRNPRLHARISLKPEDVDVICFWTRNPRPLASHLAELDRRGYRYYFQFTVLDNPRIFEPKAPTMKAGLRLFDELAGRIGPERMIWRYDPIVFTQRTGSEFHRDSFRRIAAALEGRTSRVVISVMDRYRKVERRWKGLQAGGWALAEPADHELGALMRDLVKISNSHRMEIFSCAEDLDLRPCGVRPGKCIDDDYIARTFGIDSSHQKDPSQRPACGCVISRDIGAYDTCPFRCAYCYAGNW